VVNRPYTSYVLSPSFAPRILRCLLAGELGVLLLLKELGELALEVLRVLAHLLVELVGVLLDHLLELLVVLLHLGGEGALVGLVCKELLVLLLHLLAELAVEAVELIGELLKGGGHGD
jgi:hypothetical protein